MNIILKIIAAFLLLFGAVAGWVLFAAALVPGLVMALCLIAGVWLWMEAEKRS